MRRSVLSPILGLMAGLLSPTMVLADTISWKAAVNGNWNDATKWDKNKVPGVGDDAFITFDGTYTVTFNAAAEVASLTLGGSTGTQTLSNASQMLTLDGASTINPNGAYSQSGGTLTGAGALSLKGTVNWSGGTISGAGTTAIAAGAALNISTGTTKTLTRSVTNAGTTTWTDGAINTGQGATFTNQSSGLLLLQGDNAWSYNQSGAAAQIVNQPGGVITKSITGGTTTLTLAVSNRAPSTPRVES